MPASTIRLLVTPRLRWKNDRWDITARYSKQTDKGTPWVSLPLGARDTVNEFLLDRNGNPALWTDRLTGEQIPQTNPFYGADAAPSVANCSNINNDGTRDEFGIICDPDELQWKVAFNAPIRQDSFAENASLEAIFALTDNLDVTYKFGYHDVVNDNLNDGDQLPREGGGGLPAQSPEGVGRHAAGRPDQPILRLRWWRQRLVQRPTSQLHLHIRADEP